MIIDTNNIQDVSIYLGDKCNFNCSYCDRGYIANTIGSQQLSEDDIPDLVTFFTNVRVPMVSFHGGEPFVFVKLMDKILDSISHLFPSETKVFIQTNGSLISSHRWFFEKWGERLYISISYDFMFQDINRTAVVIKPAVELLKSCGVQSIQYQYVMPIDHPKVFSLAAFKTVMDVCNSTGVRKIDLIPLRHHRGEDKFKVIVDNVNLPQFADAMIKFIHMLYVQQIDVFVDGHMDGIDKDYFNDHKQVILSPDGYMYPEYDFLEYKWTYANIGTWRPLIQFDRGNNTQLGINDRCVTCPSRPTCGLKYLYHGFDKEISGKCVQFYQLMNTIIKHAQKIKNKPSFFHWIETQ